MSDLNMDVKNDGQNLPPGASASSQDIDNTNIATSDDQGGVINDGQKKEGRDYKNLYVEADRKLQLAEERAKIHEELLVKFATPHNNQEKLTLPEASQNKTATFSQQDLELLRLSDEYLSELEQTAPAQAAKLKAERIEAYQRKNAYEEDRIINRATEKIQYQNNIDYVTKECPALNNSSSLENRAFIAEYNGCFDKNRYSVLCCSCLNIL